MKVTCIVQARIGSTRLPGKVLKKILGRPMLWYQIDRLKQSKLIEQIVIATTRRKEDQQIVDFCKENAVDFYFYRGSAEDVLDRYYQAARKFKADPIVRITADCPLIDPKVSDKVIKYYLENSDKFDHVSNDGSPTYPDGLDTEIFSFAALEKAWREARKTSEREHVTPYIWNHPEIFRLGTVKNDVDLSYMRWTVDEERDLKFVREVYRNLYKEGQIFYMEEILNLLKQQPSLLKINAGIIRNVGYIESLMKDKLVEQKGAKSL